MILILERLSYVVHHTRCVSGTTRLLRLSRIVLPETVEHSRPEEYAAERIGARDKACRCSVEEPSSGVERVPRGVGAGHRYVVLRIRFSETRLHSTRMWMTDRHYATANCDDTRYTDSAHLCVSLLRSTHTHTHTAQMVSALKHAARPSTAPARRSTRRNSSRAESREFTLRELSEQVRTQPDREDMSAPEDGEAAAASAGEEEDEEGSAGDIDVDIFNFGVGTGGIGARDYGSGRFDDNAFAEEKLRELTQLLHDIRTQHNASQEIFREKLESHERIIGDLTTQLRDSRAETENLRKAYTESEKHASSMISRLQTDMQRIIEATMHLSVKGGAVVELSSLAGLRDRQQQQPQQSGTDDGRAGVRTSGMTDSVFVAPTEDSGREEQDEGEDVPSTHPPPKPTPTTSMVAPPPPSSFKVSAIPSTISSSTQQYVDRLDVPSYAKMRANEASSGVAQNMRRLEKNWARVSGGTYSSLGSRDEWMR